MLSSVLMRKTFSDDQIRSIKKGLTSSDRLMNLRFYLLIGDFVQAQKLISEIERSKVSKSIEFKFLNIFHQIEQGNLEKSLSLLDSLEKSDSYSQEHTQLKIETLFKLKKIPEALTFIGGLGDSKEMILNKVFCFCNLGDFHSSLQVLQDFRKKDEHKTDYLLKLCKYYLKQKYDKCLNSLADKTDCSFYYLYLKLFCLTKLSQFLEASSLLNEILTIHNKLKDIWVLGGIVYYNLSKFSDSFSCFSKALQFDRQSPSDLFNLAKLYLISNKSIFEKIKLKILALSPLFEIDPGSDFKYPVINFNDFDKRKSEALPPPIEIKNSFFVKPVAKKKIVRKKKTSNERNDPDTMALIMETMKYDCTGGFTRIEEFDLPVKRKR